MAGRAVAGFADALPRVMSGTDENCTGALTRAGAFPVAGVSLACTACTASRPIPVATSPAASTVATFAPIPIPPSATPLPDGSAAEEGAERRGKRNGGEALERCALCALPALEDRAVLALAQMGPESAALGARELLLVEPGQRELGLLAGEPALELLAEGAAGPEDQGLDCADGEVEDLGDLGVRAAFELPHDDRGALVEGEEPECAADLGRGRDVGSSVVAAARLSSNSTSWGRRDESRKRCRQTLCAILISQLCGRCGRSPRWKAR